MRIGGYMFLQHCSVGGHNIFDHQIGGGHKNTAEVRLEIHDLPYSKENGGPLTTWHAGSLSASVHAHSQKYTQSASVSVDQPHCSTPHQIVKFWMKYYI